MLQSPAVDHDRITLYNSKIRDARLLDDCGNSVLPRPDQRDLWSQADDLRLDAEQLRATMSEDELRLIAVDAMPIDEE